MSTQRITWTIGMAHTKELVLLGKRILAERAYSMGLVHQVVSQEDFANRVEQLAGQFLERPPLAVGLCKKIIQEG